MLFFRAVRVMSKLFTEYVRNELLAIQFMTDDVK